MRFKDYIAEHDLSYSTVADAIGVTPESVRRYCNGERIPDQEIMPEIIKFTGGAVMPNDFYIFSQTAPQ